jgi:TPR repeat protein
MLTYASGAQYEYAKCLLGGVGVDGDLALAVDFLQKR